MVTICSGLGEVFGGEKLEVGLPGQERRKVGDIPSVAGKIVHDDWWWWCRLRWRKRGGEYGRQRRRKNLGKKWFFANFAL
jgi:hypothetical protein